MTHAHSQSGYATIAVTMIVAGLSVIAVAWQQLNLASATRAVFAAERIEQDLRLESAMNEIFADLLNEKIELDQQAVWRGDKRGLPAQIVIVRDRLDVNRTGMDSVRTAASELPLSATTRTEFVRNLESWNKDDEVAVQFLDQLFPEDTTPTEQACLRGAFTTFSTAARNRTSGMSLSAVITWVRSPARASTRRNWRVPPAGSLLGMP